MKRDFTLDVLNTPRSIIRSDQQVELVSLVQKPPGQVRSDESSGPGQEDSFHGL